MLNISWSKYFIIFVINTQKSIDFLNFQAIYNGKGVPIHNKYIYSYHEYIYLINLKIDEENYKIILMGIEEELNKLREILIWNEWLMKNTIPSKMNLPFYHKANNTEYQWSSC